MTTGVESLFDYLLASEEEDSLDPLQFGAQRVVLPALEALEPVSEWLVEGALDLDAATRPAETKSAWRKQTTPQSESIVEKVL